MTGDQQSASRDGIARIRFAVVISTVNSYEPTSLEERYRRIAELLVRAIRRGPIDPQQGPRRSVEIVITPLHGLISDELDQRILDHLALVGLSSPRQIGQALNLSHSTLVRRLKRLRDDDLVSVRGKTKRAKYELSKRPLNTN